MLIQRKWFLGTMLAIAVVFMVMAGSASSSYGESGPTTNDQSTDTVKLTLIGSSVDGEDIYKPYEVRVPKGSSLEDFYTAPYNKACQHFNNNSLQYRYYGSFRVMSKKLNELSSWEEIVDEDEALAASKRFDEDTTLYVALAKYIDTISLSVEEPLCGTEVKPVEDVATGKMQQENAPDITVNEVTHMLLGDGKMNPRWLVPDPFYVENFEGIIEGGKTYRAMVTFGKTHLGYIYDSDHLPKNLSVEGAIEGSVKCTDPNVIFFNVIAKHNWGKASYEWSADNKIVTATHKCTACGEEESETVDTNAEVKAACTEKGNTIYTASFKKEGFVKQTKTLEKAAHTWDSGKVTKEATATAAGVKTFTCTVCGATKTENIPKKESTDDAAKKAAEDDAAKKAAEEKAAKEAAEKAKYADKDKITPSDAMIDKKAKTDKKLNIKASTISTTAKIKKKSMIVKWKKVKGVTNYRIAYKEAKDKEWKYKWSKGKNSVTLTKLKNKGLYDFKIQAVKKSGSTWTKSKWSKVNYRYFVATSQKVKAGKKKVDITVKKVKGATGYEVVYSLKKDLKPQTVKAYKGAGKTKLTVKGLKAKKTYYFKTRPYKMYKGHKYIGVLNDVKSAKAK